MFFVNQVVTGTECHQVGVIGWCRNGDRAGAAHVGVAQLVCEDLQLIRGEMVVIPQHVIVRRPAGSLWRDSAINKTHTLRQI